MNNVGMYKTAKYTAYMYPKSIVICTPMQSFRISSGRYTQHYVDMLAVEIMRGRVKRLDDLKTYGGQLTWSNCSQPSSQS